MAVKKTLKRKANPLFGIESVGDRRRRQMVDIAGHLIENEGIDACRLDRVAVLAECSRPLVYRYFPKREDLLLAVLKQFDERMDEKLTSESIESSLKRFGGGDGGIVIDNPVGTRNIKQFIMSVFETVNDVGLGGWILWNSPELAYLLKQHINEVRNPFGESRWKTQMAVGGMSEIEISLAMRIAAAILTELLSRLRNGQISLAAAVDMAFNSYFSMLKGLNTDGVARKKSRRRQTVKTVTKKNKTVKKRSS